jgi:transposase
MGTPRRQPLYFSEATKRQIIEEVLQGTKSKREIWRQYTGRDTEHGKIVEWMRKLGYVEIPFSTKKVSLPMPNKQAQPSVEELQKKIKELEKKLLDSQLKEEAYRRMIDIAEKELKVSIRKKSDTK